MLTLSDIIQINEQNSMKFNNNEYAAILGIATRKVFILLNPV